MFKRKIVLSQYVIHNAIIVGGGVSGISAYNQLLSNGITDVLLFEGSDRLGGRVKTFEFNKIVNNTYGKMIITPAY